MIFLFYSTFQLFLMSFGFIISGSLLFVNPSLSLILFLIIGIPVIVRGVYYSFLFIFAKGQKKIKWIVISSMYITFALLFYFYPHFTLTFLLGVLIFYLIFITSIRGLDVYIYLRNRNWRFLLSLLSFVLLLTTMVLIIIFYHCDLSILKRAMGVILIFFGLLFVLDFWQFVFAKTKIVKILCKHKIAIPDVIGIFLPSRFLNWIKEKKILNIKNRDIDDSINVDHDVEILFHLTPYGIGIAGHCEIAYNNITFTYGNYSSNIMLAHTAGDGIIFMADKGKYIDWSVHTNHKMIICYGLKLSPKEKERFEKVFDELKNELEHFNIGECLDIKDCHDYISKVKYYADANVYRFKKGQFKTYFMPSINCVTITNYLFRKAKISNLLMYGLKTPGTYLDFIQKEYLSNSSHVVYRKVYKK